MGGYWNKVRTLPLNEVLKRGSRMIQRRTLSKLNKWSAAFRSTYIGRKDLYIEVPHCFTSISFEENGTQTLALAQLFRGHKFDLLGNGWCRVHYGMTAFGVEGNVYSTNETVTVDHEGEWLAREISSVNLSYAKKVWTLIDADYEPIPWQIDFKSGYTWSAKTWYTEIAYGHLPGVDVKVSWELARMQHLPMLARAFRVAEASERNVYVREFRNEVLDFIATNPPQFGVNWHCTMDVGIRVANWLVAYDLFRTFGASFDENFERVFASSVYDHGRHIIRNLEYSPELRSNHYLSDIAGLLFAALHLPASDETDVWLAFALQELVSEMEHEFHEDGSNFEGSTSYHRLSTELMLYGALFAVQMNEIRRERLLLYKPSLHRVQPPLKSIEEQSFDLVRKEIFPAWFWERLAKALRFTSDLLHEDGTIPQVGDNDSGRFLKLNPVYDVLTEEEAVTKYENLQGFPVRKNALYYDENILNHEHLREAYHVLCGFDIEQPVSFETAFIQSLAKEIPTIRLADNLLSVSNSLCVRDFVDTLPLTGLDVQEYHFSKPRESISRLRCYVYTGMGLYIFKSPHLYMTVRCGDVGQNGNGGHAHNDQLSITLQIDGEDVIADPGTYLYTPLPQRRNEFRSTASHFTVQKDGMEQNPWHPGSEGLFSLAREATFAKVLLLTPNAVVMEHSGFGEKVYRIVEVFEEDVCICDYGDGIKRWELSGRFSNGYGKIYCRQCDLGGE